MTEVANQIKKGRAFLFKEADGEFQRDASVLRVKKCEVSYK